MRKIKNFKINLRYREVLKLLKTTSDIKEITQQLEEAVKQEIQRIQKIIQPAAIFETITYEQMPDILKNPSPERWLAATLFLTTIGPNLEQDIKDAQRKEEIILSNILHCLSLEALEQSINFIYRIILSEAKEEECELSIFKGITSYEKLQELFNILPGEKIGIKLLENAQLEPLYSSGGVIFWIPIKKRNIKSTN